MNISFCGHYLYSTDPQKLMHFFMSVFDVENEAFNESFLQFSLADQVFKILKKTILTEVDLVLPCSFGLESISELKALSQKIEFYYYRDSMSFELDLKESSLIFSDPDGRSWNFIKDNQLNKTIPNGINQVNILHN